MWQTGSVIDPWAYFLGALLVLLLPLQWLLAAVAAAGFHELCHLGAIYALGGRVRSFHIGPIGAVMETELVGRGREVLAALAGPAGSFLLVLLAGRLPHIAICAGIQGLFNLLPLYPLDGGRVLRRLLERRLTGQAIAAVELVFSLAASLVVMRYSVYFGLFLLIRAAIGKILAKREKTGYNRATKT